MADKQVVLVVVSEDAVVVSVRGDDGSVTEQPLTLTDKIRKRMQGMKKQFFYATRREDGSLKLGSYAPWQDW